MEDFCQYECNEKNTATRDNITCRRYSLHVTS